MRSTVTIVQFTDTHFFGSPDGRLLGVDTAATFRQVCKLAADNHGSPDLYLLTGDLSQDETENAYVRLADAVKDFQAPTYFLPGNHDARSFMESVFRRSGAPLQPDRSVVAGDWQVILLDTQVPGQVGGGLSEAELDWLNTRLSEHPDKHALVAMHHHPVPLGCSWIDNIGVSNSSEFFSIVERHTNVRAVIWGHVHQEFEARMNDIRLMSSPSTCVQFKPSAPKFTVDRLPPGYRWLQLNADGTIDTRVCRTDKIPDGLRADVPGY